MTDDVTAQVESPPTTSMGRRIIAGLLVVLTSLSIVLAVVGVWAHNTLLDTDKFMATVQPALEEPALYTTLGNKVSEQALEALDLEARISTALAQLDDFLFGALVDALEIGERGQQLLDSIDRPSLEDLAPTLSSGLEARITDRIHGFVESDQFKAAVPELVERAHQATVALLRGNMEEIPNVSIADGEVTLNLIPIVAEAIRSALPDLSGLGSEINLPERLSNRADEAREQLSTALGASLPDDFGELTLMSEDRLNELQSSVVMLDRLMWILIALSIVLAVATLLVSQTKRRTAIQLGIGVVIGVVLAFLVMNWTETRVAEAIVDPAAGATAAAIVSDVLARLKQSVLILAVIASGVAIFVWAVSRKEATEEQPLSP